jgi:hypothetical protein
VTVLLPVCAVVQLPEQRPAIFHQRDQHRDTAHSALLVALVLTDAARVIELGDAPIQRAKVTLADQVRAKGWGDLRCRVL